MNHYPAGPHLSRIQEPKDLREQFNLEDLPAICDELRQFIVDVVSEKGGHFGASLGVVELTVALHYAFNTPEDQLVWDVGHQAYGHKILTGRRNQFHTNRQYGGLSGFPKRSESKFDTFGVGHSSTSISAALGATGRAAAAATAAAAVAGAAAAASRRVNGRGEAGRLRQPEWSNT